MDMDPYAAVTKVSDSVSLTVTLTKTGRRYVINRIDDCDAIAELRSFNDAHDHQLGSFHGIWEFVTWKVCTMTP